MLTQAGWMNNPLEVKQNTIYRFRILNTKFDRGDVYKIFFSYDNSCNKKIPFTIIGADSSLFHQGIYLEG